MSQNLLTLPHPHPATALKEISCDRLGFMQRCAQDYGDIVPLELGDQWFCLLTNPQYITEVLKDRLLFIKGKDLQQLRGVLGNGLLNSEGDFWLRQRRLAQPVFHQQQINSYASVMVEYTQQMLATWQDGQIHDVHEAMMRLTLNIVMKTLFDQDVNDGAAGTIAHALDEAMNWVEYQETQDVMSALTEIGEMQQLSAGRDFPQATQEAYQDMDQRYQEAIKLLDETVYAMINHRRSSGVTGKDLLGMLMEVEDADDGSRMTDKQLRDETTTLILAGHETTANALSWTWMLLAQHPHVREKLSAELKTVLNGRPPTMADLPQLPYTTWVIKESMRLYPPATDVSREATQDCEIGGYFIPKGTTLIASQWVMHRDSRYFSDPELFQPERWANDLEKQLPRGVYFPFGDGPRVCIGKSFALMEAVLLLAAIAQKFHLDLICDQTIELQPSITLRPRYGIQAVLKAVPATA
ncbi:cytochrome P450 [Richelia sinica FACHB-800]|uniref:Cytochrome P450 n=1 Tax=Richelia sinica FACHB-800 TaxID=1357546 RepID=A0A975TAC9_9NOST|nr:cytochrome P450 [Richelia sinica]MBD2664127.1 cytochrome P450 [Richelia sinica FACHB-800]QXE25039.1 cytochrome P450 [Richelia sinica FACHB-800]